MVAECPQFGEHLVVLEVVSEENCIINPEAGYFDIVDLEGGHGRVLEMDVIGPAPVRVMYHHSKKDLQTEVKVKSRGGMGRGRDRSQL